MPSFVHGGTDERERLNARDFQAAHATNRRRHSSPARRQGESIQQQKQQRAKQLSVHYANSKHRAGSCCLSFIMIMALWFMMTMLPLTCLPSQGINPATPWDVSVIALITALMCYFARPTSSPTPLSQPMPVSPPPPSPSPAVAVPPVAAGTVGSTSANPELMAAESLSVDAPAVADAPTAANQAEESILQDLRQFFSSIAMAVWLPCKNAYRVFKRLCGVIYRIATKYAPRSTLAVCVVVAMFGSVSHMRNWSAVSTIVQSAVKASWTPICDPGFVISDVRHNDFPYCEACPRGRHPADQRKKCVKCKPGSYAQTAGLAQCSDCEPGKFAQNEGAHVCTMCPKGHFAPTGAASCSPCPSGRYAPHTGQGPQCIACAAGTFASETGTTACEACRPGKYAPRVAMASCDFCHHGEIAEAAGALACTRGISIPERGLFETVRDSLNELCASRLWHGCKRSTTRCSPDRRRNLRQSTGNTLRKRHHQRLKTRR